MHNENSYNNNTLFLNYLTRSVAQPSPSLASNHSTDDHGNTDCDKTTTHASPMYRNPRHIVFYDLHQQGYTLTSGLKFGCDYLAYPGDPMIFHAQFMVCVTRTIIRLRGQKRGQQAVESRITAAQGINPIFIAATAR